MRYPQKAKGLKEDSQGSNYKIKLAREYQMEAKNLIDSRRSSILVLFSMKTLWLLSSQSFHNVAEIALNQNTTFVLEGRSKNKLEKSLIVYCREAPTNTKLSIRNNPKSTKRRGHFDFLHSI